MLRASAAHFPGVGWLVGGVVALLTWGLQALLPAGSFAPLVAATLGTALSVVMTGAFHEDGLADVADGLGGSYNRERALEIMKDSRVGAFGAIAVMLALLCKVALAGHAGLAQHELDGGRRVCCACGVPHLAAAHHPAAAACGG